MPSDISDSLQPIVQTIRDLVNPPPEEPEPEADVKNEFMDMFNLIFVSQIFYLPGFSS